MRTLFSYPDSASGLICTGTSMATLLGLSIARFRALGEAVRATGNSQEPLTAYCSAQAHVLVQKALELMGMGTASLRLVPVHEDFSMDCQALADMVSGDIAAGNRPFAVVSSVGSVNTGAIDDLPAINQLCRKQGIWHHVDGAFGALLILSQQLKHRLEGIEQADSIAFDFHKWMHITYASGCLLVRDGDLHQRAFATSHPYLRGENRGAAGGGPWPSDFGIDLSRGFSALGVWMQFKEMGSRRLGEAIQRNFEQAAWLADAIESQPSLELAAPVSLNIVCYRFRNPGDSPEAVSRLNRRIVVELQCRGIAVPSFTHLGGDAAIRVCITNHRTRLEDLQVLVEESVRIGEELQSRSDQWGDFDTNVERRNKT